EEINPMTNYKIFCLNTPALRGLTGLSKSQPLGIYGESLDVLLANLDKNETEQLKSYSYMIDWLDEYLIDVHDMMKLQHFKLNLGQSRLYFSDKYMAKGNNVFSIENANEGILHVLFYLALMISKKTPKFFAIDNIESCLNPHLARHITREICKLAKENDKQLLITTHNPAILDGLNLRDDEIRLFEVSRNRNGHTVTRRIKVKPDHQDSEGRSLKLSELWTRGYLGAISENF
ncbi:MAG TPA: AAA family ATPase, partial [Saprospiraceae bacterium]|nr:AAA family ATPase [Saprospiraceae bacterium]